MSLSDEISRLASEYDPVREADASAVRAYAQGLLTGVVMRGDLPIKLAHSGSVMTPQDDQGNYLDHFFITTQEGHRLKVTVEVD